MRPLIVLISCLLCSVSSKYNPKPLTESMGQEIIEISSPLKDLHPDIEEEPSAEIDEADKSTITTLQAGTARASKKITAIETRRQIKNTDKISGNKQEDEEAKIEKELADLYKDTDYKADSAEVTTGDLTSTEQTANETLKPVARLRDEFKFQPDVNNRKEVEKFRTSVDEISCEKNKLNSGVTDSPNSGHKAMFCRTFVWTAFVIAQKFM